MTSNLGTRDLKKAGGMGFSKDELGSEFELMERQVKEEMKRLFSPEFLNRIDDTLVFHQLGRSEIAEIIDMQIEEINKRILEKEISISLTQSARELLSEKGYDPVYNARFMNQTIQRMVEDPLAEEILKGKFVEGDDVRVGKKGEELTFYKADSGSSDEAPVLTESEA